MANVPRMLNDKQKAFIGEIESMSQSYSIHDKFRDAVRCMAIALHGPVIVDKKEFQSGEDEYKTYVEKYGADGMTHMAQAFGIVAEALEAKREDFLGNVLESIGAANSHAGQFLTPKHVARLMAEISMPLGDGKKHVDGEIVTINDPTCGASVLMIEGAEELIQNQKVAQRDVLIYAEDLDYNAFNMSYVQLSLLGYAAQVTRMDSLSNTVYEGPWFTPGYFLHAMPMRLTRNHKEVEEKVGSPTDMIAAKDGSPVQGELGL